MDKYRLKFLLFVTAIIVLVMALLWLEGRRDHPEYAPMFSSQTNGIGNWDMTAIFAESTVYSLGELSARVR